MEAVLIILAVFSVPLVGILSSTWLKYKKLQLEAGAPSSETSRRLKLLEEHNEELQKRIETLETITVMGHESPKELGHDLGRIGAPKELPPKSSE